jgi:ATP-binding cassette subfamily F protein uup
MILSVENLAHSYGDRTLFSGVTFNIEAGDKIGVIGVNGTGKSTLLRHVARLDGGREGKIMPNGACVIEYLPQEPEYDPRATVLEQIFQGNSPLVVLLRRYEQALALVNTHPEDAVSTKAVSGPAAGTGQ